MRGFLWDVEEERMGWECRAFTGVATCSKARNTVGVGCLRWLHTPETRLPSVPAARSESLADIAHTARDPVERVSKHFTLPRPSPVRKRASAADPGGRP